MIPLCLCLTVRKMDLENIIFVRFSRQTFISSRLNGMNDEDTPPLLPVHPHPLPLTNSDFAAQKVKALDYIFNLSCQTWRQKPPLEMLKL